MLSDQCKSLGQIICKRQQVIQEELIQGGQAEQGFEGFVCGFG